MKALYSINLEILIFLARFLKFVVFESCLEKILQLVSIFFVVLMELKIDPF